MSEQAPDIKQRQIESNEAGRRLLQQGEMLGRTVIGSHPELGVGYASGHGETVARIEDDNGREITHVSTRKVPGYENRITIKQNTRVKHGHDGENEPGGSSTVEYSYESPFDRVYGDLEGNGFAGSVEGRLDPGDEGFGRGVHDMNPNYTRPGLRVDRTGANGEKFSRYLKGDRAEKARNILQRRAARKMGEKVKKVAEMKKGAA